MTKSTPCDHGPYDTRPVSLLQLNDVSSQDAMDGHSRYEEVNRHLAHEFPQLAGGFGQHSWMPFTPLDTERQESNIAGLADDATSAIHAPVCDSELTTVAGYSLSMHDNMPLPAPLPPDFSESLALDAYFDLDASATQAQGPYHNFGMPTEYMEGVEEQRGESHPIGLISTSMQPVEHIVVQSSGGESREFANEALAEGYCIGRNMNQIIYDLIQLGTRLRADARRQLDVIRDDCAAFPLSS